MQDTATVYPAFLGKEQRKVVDRCETRRVLKARSRVDRGPTRVDGRSRRRIASRSHCGSRRAKHAGGRRTSAAVSKRSAETTIAPRSSARGWPGRPNAYPREPAHNRHLCFLNRDLKGVEDIYGNPNTVNVWRYFP